MSVTSLYDLTPGTRVVVANAMGHLSGQRGVVIDMAPGFLNGHDCCVEMDPHDDIRRYGDGGQLCFYAYELAVVK